MGEDSYGYWAGDANFYRYVYGNPTNFVDPSGNLAWLLIPLLASPEALAWAGLGAATTWAIWDAWNKNPTWNFPSTDTGGGEVCNYEPAPDDITDLFPNAKREKSKNQRKRWRDSKNGDIYEWDYQHGDVEIYNKRGKHKGSQNPKSKKKKPPVPGRKTDK